MLQIRMCTNLLLTLLTKAKGYLNCLIQKELQIYQSFITLICTKIHAWYFYSDIENFSEEHHG